MRPRRPLISGKDLTILALIGTVVYLVGTSGKIVVQPIIDLSKINDGKPSSGLSTIAQALLSYTPQA